MFKAVKDQPYVFSDGSKLSTFRHEKIALDVFHDDKTMSAFAFLWPIEKVPVKTMQFSWHRDYGFRSGVSTPSADHPDVGHFEKREIIEREELADLLDEEGDAIPAIFKDKIISVLKSVGSLGS
jgi:hypothetical protein